MLSQQNLQVPSRRPFCFNLSIAPKKQKLAKYYDYSPARQICFSEIAKNQYQPSYWYPTCIFYMLSDHFYLTRENQNEFIARLYIKVLTNSGLSSQNGWIAYIQIHRFWQFWVRPTPWNRLKVFKRSGIFDPSIRILPKEIRQLIFMK